MIDLNQFFYKQMVREELSKSRKHGCTLFIPVDTIGEPLKKNDLISLQEIQKVQFNKALLEIYEKVGEINIRWELFDKEGDPRVTTDQFKQDEWLVENYLNKDYSWDFVKELLGGSIFVPPAERLMGRKKNIEDTYFVVLEAMGLDPESFCPFDYQTRTTALLKIEDGVVVDNLWLLDMDARNLYDMQVSIEKYLDLAYKAKLFNGWQLVYMLKKKTDYHELMKRYLPMLVPHLELDLKEFGIQGD